MSGALREIVAAFGVEFDGKGLKQGDSAINGMISSLKKLTVAASGAFGLKIAGDFVFGLAEQAEELKHHAEALGISAQSLQKWDFAASLSGVSADELQIGLQKLQRSAVGAGKGGGDLAGVFSKLGVSVKSSNGDYKNADELLTDVAGAIGDMKDPTLQTATAMQIFGRGGARLLPFLKQGRAGVAGLKAEVEALGGGFTEDFIEKSEQMVQNSKKLDFAFRSFKVKALGPLIPLLTEMAEGATKWLVKAGDMIGKSNAGKAALVAFGVGAAVAFAPLLVSVAAAVAAFLLLEDALTFLTGGDSLTGDLLDKYFGQGAAAKVKAFADAIGKDVGPALHDIFAIFTDGQPLEVKFQQLYDYVSNVLKPRFKADFGEMGESIASLVTAAGELASALNSIVKAMSWIGSHTIGAARRGINAIDASSSAEDAASAARAATGETSFYDKVRNFLAPNSDTVKAMLGSVHQGGGSIGELAKANAPKYDLSAWAADTDYLHASGPIMSLPGPTEVNQTNQISIVQNIKADTPEDVKRAASEGAKAGVTSGTNDRTKRALVPTAG